MKLLIIEDEASLSDSICAYLQSEDYVCEKATSYNTAIEKIDHYDYDCILLDISLPDGNGLEILKELKANQRADGIIIISAKNSIDDRIKGLNIGADDYIAKPFHLSELNARIAAVIRRRVLGGSTVITYEDIKIDTFSKEVTLNDALVDLTKKEYQLLLYFVANKGKVVSKNAIAHHLWEEEVLYNFDFIYTHIKNLRKKLQDAGGQDYIKSIYGMGYKFGR